MIENWCISVDFRCIFGTGSGLCDFADYQINITSFEKGPMLKGSIKFRIKSLYDERILEYF
jgi:hypothetical protein